MTKSVLVGDIDWKRFGERIGREVDKCGLSYRELAEELGGITYASLNRVVQRNALCDGHNLSLALQRVFD